MCDTYEFMKQDLHKSLQEDDINTIETTVECITQTVNCLIYIQIAALKGISRNLRYT